MSLSEWKEVKLGDLLNFRRGHDLPKTNMVFGAVPVVGSNGVIGYHNSSTTKAPCLTIGRSGNVGNPCFINKDCWAHNTTLYVDDYKGNNPLYLFYLLKTINLSHYGGGSAVPTLNRNHIHPIIIRATINRSEQSSIAATLSCLDDMIELNNNINQVLGGMAQAIFRHWFVDFEFPNEEGEPYKSSGGKMVESELGEIPKGWRVIELGDICQSISKKHCFNKNELIFLNTSDILSGQVLHNEYSKVDDMPGQAKKSIQYGDILFSEIRPANKRYAYVNFDSDDYVVSTKLMVIRANEEIINSRHLYHYLTSEKTLNYLQSIAESRSGTFPQITFTHIAEIKTIIPPSNIEREIGLFFELIYKNIDLNNAENKRLTNIRDTLLPKLMTGEIRVPIEEVS